MPKMVEDSEVGSSSSWITGAYQWRNLVNGKVYVGGAYKSFLSRKRAHLYLLRDNRHGNKRLQRSWNKHGEFSFVFEILEKCPPEKEKILACEQKWIDRINPTDIRIGYNQCPNAQSRLGCYHSEETKVKLSAWERTEETREKMSAWQRGRKLSESHRASMSKSKKGRKFSEETKKKMSAWQKGVKKPVEAVAKMAASMRGKKASEEARRKMSISQTGRKHSEETKQKMAEAAKREEVIQKKQSAANEYWDKVRSGLIPPPNHKKAIAGKIIPMKPTVIALGRRRTGT